MLLWVMELYASLIKRTTLVEVLMVCSAQESGFTCLLFPVYPGTLNINLYKHRFQVSTISMFCFAKVDSVQGDTSCPWTTGLSMNFVMVHL